MDIVTGNPTVIKMVIHYTRGERGQNVLRELIGPIVKEVLERKDLILLTSPVDVYRAWINQMETQTGEASYVEFMLKIYCMFGSCCDEEQNFTFSLA